MLCIYILSKNNVCENKDEIVRFGVLTTLKHHNQEDITPQK
jgi:hypothetical protein